MPAPAAADERDLGRSPCDPGSGLVEDDVEDVPSLLLVAGGLVEGAEKGVNDGAIGYGP